MIKLFRNTEFSRTVFIFLIITVLSSAAALIYDPKLLIPVISVCAAFTAVHIISGYKRYRRISMLSTDIDKLLHGDESISFRNYSEGELALLESEIYKMTIRLREQQTKLTEDKVYLADLLADISHQIRTPLTSINILVSMLSAPDISYEKREQTVHKLYGLLSRIEWLITALLKMSKLDAGTVRFRCEEIKMNELLEKACMPIRVPMELRGQELVIEAEGNIECDESWSCEAIGNIIKNCMEHTFDGGRIIVKGKENTLYSEIIIKDNGVGIDADDLPHIFERFYKGKSSEDKGGFGIGLALARTIVTGQNGTIKAENPPDGGAQFTIRFYRSTV